MECGTFFIKKPHKSQLWRRDASAIAKHLANLSKDPPYTFVNVSARKTQLFKKNCSKVLPSTSKLSIMCRPRLQETGRAKQLTLYNGLLPSGATWPTSSKITMCCMPTTATIVASIRLGVGEREHFFEKSEIFGWLDMKSLYLKLVPKTLFLTFVLVF